MRATTAIALIACGLSLVPASMLHIRENIRLFIQSSAAMIAAMITIVVLVAWSVAATTEGSLTQAIRDGLAVPSLGTIVGISLFSSAMIYRAVAAMAGLNCVPSIWVGWIVTALGALGVIGHTMRFPHLYWSFESISVGMALHTAIAILSLGVGLLVMPRPGRVAIP